MNSKALLSKYKATNVYIITTVVVNILYSIFPYFFLLGCKVSPCDMIVGSIYIVRDFAQREIGHKVVFAMVVAAVLSYLLAAQQVALASAAAFVVGETIDWIIFTVTKKPLSQRLLWSSMISAPIDTTVFLCVLGNLNWVEFTALTFAKFVGVLLLWTMWRRRDKIANQSITMGIDMDMDNANTNTNTMQP